MVLQLALYFHL